MKVRVLPLLWIERVPLASVGAWPHPAVVAAYAAAVWPTRPLLTVRAAAARTSAAVAAANKGLFLDMRISVMIRWRCLAGSPGRGGPDDGPGGRCGCVSCAGSTAGWNRRCRPRG